MATGWTAADREQVEHRLAELVVALPGTEVVRAHGHTGYSVRRKRFGWLLDDHHGDGRLALCVKAPPSEQEALVSADPQRYFVPAYLGAKGWVGAALDPGSGPDWAEVASLLEQAWRMTAGARLTKQLDASPTRERG